MRTGLTMSLLSVASLTFVSPAGAQDVSDEVDGLFSSIAADAPGCAVAVSQAGAPVVSRAYGVASLEAGTPNTPSTVFDIGSVQKQFVAAAILLLVEDGRLALSDDVRRHVPELHDFGHTITIDHLLTHTSGLRDWVGLANFAVEDEDALTLILRQRGLNFEPGTEWSYSNSGYVLLKEIVARTSGMPFAEFARTRLFEPLGMEATQYADDIRAALDGAVAYEKRGDDWRPEMMLGQDRGGGAVLSTADDLVTWTEAWTSGRLGAFVRNELRAPARLTNGRELSYARGLMLEESRGRELIWHGGSARAFKALVGHFPGPDLSLAILCNAGDGANPTQFAAGIVDLFDPRSRADEPDADAPADAREAVRTPDADVTGRAGLYFDDETGESLRLVVNGGALQVPGGPRLVTVDENRFRSPAGRLSFMSQAEFEIRFVSADEFELRSAEGETTRYRRALDYAPTADELRELAGRFESDELGAYFEAIPDGTALSIRLNGAQTIEFAPVDADTFQRGPLTVRFVRDQDGRVVALDFSNPVLRSVRFERAGG